MNYCTCIRYSIFHCTSIFTSRSSAHSCGRKLCIVFCITVILSTAAWPWQIITLLLFAKFVIFSPKERSIDQFNNIGNPESKLRLLVPDANDRTQFRFKETKKLRYSTILYPCNSSKLYSTIHTNTIISVYIHIIFYIHTLHVLYIVYMCCR